MRKRFTHLLFSGLIVSILCLFPNRLIYAAEDRESQTTAANMDLALVKEDLEFLKEETVSIAGGIILFLIALKMIFPQPGGVTGLAVGEEPFLVPLAIPMIAGPSILAALILLANQDPERMNDWAIALLLAWAVSAAILMFSGLFHRLLGERGLTAIERLMGMILVMISIQMLLDGVTSYFGASGI